MKEGDVFVPLLGWTTATVQGSHVGLELTYCLSEEEFRSGKRRKLRLHVTDLQAAELGAELERIAGHAAAHQAPPSKN